MMKNVTMTSMFVVLTALTFSGGAEAKKSTFQCWAGCSAVNCRADPKLAAECMADCPASSVMNCKRAAEEAKAPKGAPAVPPVPTPVFKAGPELPPPPPPATAVQALDVKKLPPPPPPMPGAVPAAPAVTQLPPPPPPMPSASAVKAPAAPTPPPMPPVASKKRPLESAETPAEKRQKVITTTHSQAHLDAIAKGVPLKKTGDAPAAPAKTAPSLADSMKEAMDKRRGSIDDSGKSASAGKEDW